MDPVKEWLSRKKVSDAAVTNCNVLLYFSVCPSFLGLMPVFNFSLVTIFSVTISSPLQVFSSAVLQCGHLVVPFFPFLMYEAFYDIRHYGYTK